MKQDRREGQGAQVQDEGGQSKRQKFDAEGISTGLASEQTQDTKNMTKTARASKWDTPLRAPTGEPAKLARQNRWDLTPAAANPAQAEVDPSDEQSAQAEPQIHPSRRFAPAPSTQIGTWEQKSTGTAAFG